MQRFRIKLSLFINYFVIAILLNTVGTVILQVQSNFGVSPQSASVLEGCKDLSIAFGSFLIASYIARIGYKKSMLIALAMITLMCFAMPSLSSFWATKILFVIVGISFAFIKISVFATIGLVTNSDKEHSSFMSFLESNFMIGSLAGNFIFSFFIDSQDPSSTSWFKVYYLLSAMAAMAFLLLYSAKLDESSVKPTKSTSFQSDFIAMLALIKKPIVAVFIFSAFFYVLLEQSIMSWLPTFNNQILKLPTVLSIQMASILTFSTALGRFLAGGLLKKMNWYMVVSFCLVLAAGLVLVAMPLVKSLDAVAVTSWSNAPIIAFLFPLIGLLLAPIYPAINSVILSSLPKPQHASMSGLIVVFSALGGTTGSLIMGVIFQNEGGETAFYFSLIPIAILLFILYYFRKLQNKH